MVAGWPETVCGTTVDRQCGLAPDELQRRRRDLGRPTRGGRLGRGGDDVARADGLERRRPLGQIARALADRAAGDLRRGGRGQWDLSRDALDAYSLESHRRAIAAIDDGKFEQEIVPVEVSAAGAAVLFAVDEAPRRDTSAEKLASLGNRSLPDGVVTAGNSSQIVDGAAAVLVTSERAATRLGLEPRARFVSFGLSASTRTGCCTGTRRPAGRRSRRPVSRGTTSRWSR